ncbi:MAG: S4 domain-containing protein [Rhodanobacter sp.]
MIHQQEVTEVRVDIWLWVARFFKTRSLAKQAIDGGKIDVNGGGCKPAKVLRVGDQLKITRGEERMEIVVLALSIKRSAATVAQALYSETELSRTTREAVREQRQLIGEQHTHPSVRPNKQDRRALRQLKASR